MENKKCSVCLQEKPLAGFAKDKRLPDGCKTYCKECRKSWDAKYRSKAEVKEQRKVRYSGYQREYKRAHPQVRPAGYDPRVDATGHEEKKALWYKNNPDAALAHSRLFEAIKAGKLPKAATHNCAQCSNQASDYHHHNGYGDGRELDVIPLCRSCHRLAHSPYS